MMRSMSLQIAKRSREKHGLKDSPEYATWHRMRRRCHDPDHPDYPTYGAKGIVVCPEWQQSFLEFYRAMGNRPSPLHSIDRKDNTKGYEPGNCRWATKEEQARNRPSFVLKVNGKTAAEAAAETGLKAPTLYNRLRRGLPDREALSTTKFRTGGKPPRLLTMDGQTLPLRTWARKMGIKAVTLRQRLDNGWPVRRALTVPAIARYQRKKERTSVQPATE